MEQQIEILATKLFVKSTKEVSAIVSDIAKKTKKKTMSSGTGFYLDYCKMIAKTLLTKESTKELIVKYNLV